MSYYIGILDGHGDVWGVSIPDFPGCYGGGPSAEAAIADVTSALRVFAGVIAADGEPMPKPRPFDELRPDERPGKDESLVMIPLLLDKGRTTKANVSIDAGILEQIDAEAKRRGLTRSAFLVSAAVDKIIASR